MIKTSVAGFSGIADTLYGETKATEDLRQIKRWRAFRPHAGAIRNFCEPYAFPMQKKQRQALLHWAYDSRNI